MEVRELCISCSFNFDFKNVQVFNLVYWIHNLFMFTESGVIPQASCKGFPKLQINPDGRKLTTLDTSSIHEHLVVYNPGHPIIHRAPPTNPAPPPPPNVTPPGAPKPVPPKVNGVAPAPVKPPVPPPTTGTPPPAPTAPAPPSKKPGPAPAPKVKPPPVPGPPIVGTPPLAKKAPSAPPVPAENPFIALPKFEKPLLKEDRPWVKAVGEKTSCDRQGIKELHMSRVHEIFRIWKKKKINYEICNLLQHLFSFQH